MDIYHTAAIVPLSKTATLGGGRREAQPYVTIRLTHIPMQESFLQGSLSPNKLPRDGCVTNRRVWGVTHVNRKRKD
jgi:hypothetical protein